MTAIPVRKRYALKTIRPTRSPTASVNHEEQVPTGAHTSGSKMALRARLMGNLGSAGRESVDQMGKHPSPVLMGAFEVQRRASLAEALQP
jgi:hypothetical protein